MSKLTHKITLAVAPLLGSLLIRLIGLTMRFKVENAPEHKEGERAIFTFWHGRMLMIPILRFMRYQTDRRGPFTVMVSRHRDGELISRTIGYLGIGTSRGSTTRGGASVLKEVIRLARKGYNIAITPDGPKGPRFTVQMGTIQAAKATGLPIFPVTFSARKKKL